MKKLYPLIIAFLFSSQALWSKSVDVNQAMLVAQNFYKQTTGQTATLTLAYQCTNTDINNGVALGEPIYYAFNVSGNAGFVMVAADDLARPIIGYNTTGQFKIQNAPPAITGWFGKYSKQIAAAKANLTSATQEISNQWSRYSGDPNKVTKQLRTGGAVGPLLLTTWDQTTPYNTLCPADPNSLPGYGGNCPTGCGATAMSQIMRYWSYPAQGTGQNSYTSSYGVLSANFGATTYNWANMPYTDDPNNPSADISNIMFDCGVAVDMDYTYDESLSYILSGTGGASSCQQAYTTYFGYDANAIQGLSRANYPTESDWTNLIQNELNSNRPIQYAGSGPNGGHTFVLDGSDGSGNFHINWGWSGADNGFYSIDALDPGTESFDNNESMIIGIQPPNTTVVSSGIDLYEAITVTPNPIAFLNTFTVTTNVINDGTSGFNGSYCCAFFDSKGNFIRFIGDILSTGAGSSNALPAGDYYNSGFTFADTTTFVTVPGTYTIGIYYQPIGINTWTLAGQSTYTNPITVTVDGADDPGITLTSAISPSPTTFIQGEAASVNVNLGNDGSATYYGTYEAVLLDLQGTYVETIGTFTESTGLPVGDDYQSPFLTFSTANVTAPEGEYILAIAEEAQGTTQYYYCGGQNFPNPVLIDVVNTDITVSSITQVSADPLRIYPNPATNSISIDAGDVHGAYTLAIFNTLGQQMTESTGNLNGLPLSADVSSFAGGIYTIQLKAASGVLNTKFVVK